jgi:hypothetical protein
MPRRSYNTVGDELLEPADLVGDYFEVRGHRVRVERNELGFPSTPTFVCTRGNTTTIVELDRQIRFARLEQWVRFGKSCNKDTRFALCLPSSVMVTADDEARLRETQIGLYAVFSDHRGVVERIPPADLCLNVALPPLVALPRKIRELLGPAYDQFGRSQWREGFGDACQALEVEARRYLKKWSRTGRITFLRQNRPVVIPGPQIDRMTLGQLAATFAAIQNQNHADSVIGQALSTVNRDRVRLTHHKSRATTERSLRSNVGKHMWVILAAFKELV